MADQKIKDKIAALLAKAEGTDNEFEAETFMAKVNELLERHQLEMHEVRKDADPMGHEKGDTKFYASQSWAKDFIFAVCNYYGGEGIVHSFGNTRTFTVIGRESVRTTVTLMMPYLLTQLRRAGRRYAAHYGRTESVATREVANALIIRLYREAQVQEAHRADLVGKGLIPVSDLEAYKDEKFPNLREARMRNLDHSHSAKKLADGIALHAAATGKHVKLLK